MDIMRICFYIGTIVLMAGPFAVQLSEDSCIKNYRKCSKSADATLQNRLTDAYFSGGGDDLKKAAYDGYVLQMGNCVDELEECNNQDD